MSLSSSAAQHGELFLQRMKQAQRNRRLSWWERIYIPALVQGLRITARHFWRNLFLHIAHQFGFLKDVPAAVTIQYPEQLRATSSRLRTRHRLTQRPDGTPRCVGCMMCETVCPARCIYIRPAEHPDPHIEKFAKSFDINLGLCIYCGYCVEACPEDAIRMDTQIHSIASYSRDGMWLNMRELLYPGSSGKNAPPEKFKEYTLEGFRQLRRSQTASSGNGSA